MFFIRKFLQKLYMCTCTIMYINFSRIIIFFPHAFSIFQRVPLKACYKNRVGGSTSYFKRRRRQYVLRLSEAASFASLFTVISQAITRNYAPSSEGSNDVRHCALPRRHGNRLSTGVIMK